MIARNGSGKCRNLAKLPRAFFVEKINPYKIPRVDHVSGVRGYSTLPQRFIKFRQPFCCRHLFQEHSSPLKQYHIFSNSQIGSETTKITMGASSSKEAVHENMIAAVLLGNIASDDYLARAHKALTELRVGQPPSIGPQPFMEFYNVHLMLEPGPQPLEHGLVRMGDGTWFIACKTDLGTEITGEMFDWWFRNCTGNDRFKWWHPLDHRSGDWNPQVANTMTRTTITTTHISFH